VTYPIVVSFYTNPFYRDLSMRLGMSCRAFGLDVDIRERAAQPTRKLTVQEKPKFILEMILGTDQDILWVDACAYFVKKPVLFESPKFSIACHRRSVAAFSAAVMYFKNDLNSARVLDKWIELNAESPDAWEEATLSSALLSETGFPQVLESLPPEYCWFGKNAARLYPEGQCPVVHDPVIFHPDIHTEVAP